VGVVALLVLAAFFAAAPWLGCVIALPFWQVTSFSLRACTFGDLALRVGYGLPGFAGPYWGNLIVGIAYVIAAAFAALTKRSL
jgi:hypothetical protein